MQDIKIVKLVEFENHERFISDFHFSSGNVVKAQARMFDTASPGLVCLIEHEVEDMLRKSFLRLKCHFKTNCGKFGYAVSHATKSEDYKINGRYNYKWVEPEEGWLEFLNIFAPCKIVGEVPWSEVEGCIINNW